MPDQNESPQAVNIVRQGKASLSAVRVARLRAAHQLLDDPKILDDPLAVPILGPNAGAEIVGHPELFDNAVARPTRMAMVVRSRFAEDELQRAVQDGITQYVVLGAGLDTFAYRNVYETQGLRVFEVDHPSTQQWKRTLLANAAIRIPDSLTFVPVDFEHTKLRDGLARSSFRFDQPAFFSWLGVMVYLTDDAIFDTFGFIATLPRGTGIVFDYSLKASLLAPIDRGIREVNGDTVTKLGEPWVSFFDPVELTARLRQTGFSRVDDWPLAALTKRFLADRGRRLPLSGTSQLMYAEV